ncbi:MAG: hypothetical protein ACRD6X_06370, partial [Pyrinomonadaceae bacterium]
QNTILDDWEREVSTTCSILLELYTTGMVELHVHQPQFMREISEFPTVSALARWQLTRGDSITTMNITTAKVDDAFFRNLILMLDGTRDRAELKRELRKKISAGEFSDIGPKAELLIDLPAMLKENLEQIAALGLLVA